MNTAKKNFGAEFGANLLRLMGLHQIVGIEGRHIFGLSPQAISDLKYRKRQPSLSTAHLVSEFFEVPIERLLDTPFGDLLEGDLADAERFLRVENKIEERRKSAGLRTLKTEMRERARRKRLQA